MESNFFSWLALLFTEHILERISFNIQIRLSECLSDSLSKVNETLRGVLWARKPFPQCRPHSMLFYTDHHGGGGGVWGEGGEDTSQQWPPMPSVTSSCKAHIRHTVPHLEPSRVGADPWNKEAKMMEIWSDLDEKENLKKSGPCNRYRPQDFL